MKRGQSKRNIGIVTEGVHDDLIKTSSDIQYLGDWVSPKLDNRKNIEERVNKGIGTTSQILSLLRHVSLVYFFVEICLIFRDSMLIRKLLFNSEIWLDLKEMV